LLEHLLGEDDERPVSTSVWEEFFFPTNFWRKFPGF